MGSPFGPALADIFVGYYEEKLFSQTQKPPTYLRYVDDTFAIFDHKAEPHEFLIKLNCLHSSLKFTFEKEKDKCLPFLDVYVEKTDIGFETSVYRKPTFIGHYLRWESFSPLKHKISLISTLVHRALIIYTKRRLNGEIERIKKILLDNGYPKNVINTQIAKKTAQFFTLKRFGPEKCSEYLRIFWIGKPSTKLEKEVKTAVESCYSSVSTRLVFTSKHILPVARKDVPPIIQKSFVRYEYKCHCDCRYVVLTSRRDCVAVRASALRSVDLGFNSLVESYQKTLKNSIHSFSAWRSAFRGDFGKQAGKFACCVLGQSLDTPIFMWKTGGPDTSLMATPKRVWTFRPNYSDTIRFLVNGG